MYQVARAKSSVKTIGELLVEQCEVYRVYMYLPEYIYNNTPHTCITIMFFRLQVLRAINPNVKYTPTKGSPHKEIDAGVAIILRVFAGA